jgi:hypothetical protein
VTPIFYKIQMQQQSNKEQIPEEKSHFLTPKKFEEQINQLVDKDKCTHLEAIFIWCSRNDVDYQDTLPLISNTLKQNLEIDGIDNGLLKRKRSLF